MWGELKQLVPKAVRIFMKRLMRNVRDTGRLANMAERQWPEDVQHVVFVCKGNICRSAFAEYYLAAQPGVPTRVESCGLDAATGGPSPDAAVVAARQFGVDLSGHRSRGLDDCDLQSADLILPMEYSQYALLLALLPEKRERIFLLRPFAPGATGWLCNIDDPYGLGQKQFTACFRMISRSLDRLMERLGKKEVPY